MTSHKFTPIQLPLPIEGETFEIPLTRGYVTVVDAVDADLALHKWQVCKPENVRVAYAVRVSSSAEGKKNERVHRIILSRMLARTLTRSEHTDHIDGDGLNNRRANLRVATASQNIANSVQKLGISGYRGVSPKNGRWVGHITVNRRCIFLGIYDTPELAYEAYCKAALKYFGEFAKLS